MGISGVKQKKLFVILGLALGSIPSCPPSLSPNAPSCPLLKRRRQCSLPNEIFLTEKEDTCPKSITPHTFSGAFPKQ